MESLREVVIERAIHEIFGVEVTMKREVEI